MSDSMAYKLRVLMSGAGYYIGTTDELGMPYSRESGYFRTEEEAEKELKEMWKYE